MKRENLHQPFEISFNELEESLLKEHDHTFFELVYIYIVIELGFADESHSNKLFKSTRDVLQRHIGSKIRLINLNAEPLDTRISYSLHVN